MFEIAWVKFITYWKLFLCSTIDLETSLKLFLFTITLIRKHIFVIPYQSLFKIFYSVIYPYLLNLLQSTCPTLCSFSWKVGWHIFCSFCSIGYYLVNTYFKVWNQVKFEAKFFPKKLNVVANKMYGSNFFVSERLLCIVRISRNPSLLLSPSMFRAF